MLSVTSNESNLADRERKRKAFLSKKNRLAKAGSIYLSLEKEISLRKLKTNTSKEFKDPMPSQDINSVHEVVEPRKKLGVPFPLKHVVDDTDRKKVEEMILQIRQRMQLESAQQLQHQTDDQY